MRATEFIIQGWYSVCVWIVLISLVSIIQYWYAWVTDTKAKRNAIFQWMIDNLALDSVFGKDDAATLCIVVGCVVFFVSPMIVTFIVTFWVPVLYVTSVLVLIVGISYLARMLLRLKRTVTNHIYEPGNHPWTPED